MVPLLSSDARSGNTVQGILLMMPHDLAHKMAERHLWFGLTIVMH